MTGEMRGGFFVDVGAHDGVVHSNTLLLERDYEWRGVCIEPQSGPFQQLTASRRAACVQTAVLNADGEALLLHDRIAAGGAPVSCLRLASVLDLVDVSGTIDYLSVDVEGSELEVIASHDFERWPVNLITIEHNLYANGPAHKNSIFKELTALGFERVREDVVAPGYGPYEDWFLNAALRVA